MSIPDNAGVYFVPAFVGLGTPYWDSEARGLLCGLTRGTGRAHIVRAALEAIAYQTAQVIRAMETDTACTGSIRVDGGAAANDFLMQFQADILDRVLLRPDCTESTALGAPYLAGIGAGLWKECREITALPRREKAFRPAMHEEQRRQLLAGWEDAVRRTLTP